MTDQIDARQIVRIHLMRRIKGHLKIIIQRQHLAVNCRQKRPEADRALIVCRVGVAADRNLFPK